MFKLAESSGGSAGLYCGTEGLFLGPSPLIARAGVSYRIRADDEIARLLAAAYGSTDEAQGLRPRLPLIRAALQEGDLCRAMILAVQARLGPMAPEGVARLAQTASLSKHNFNRYEPRDPDGRWTTAEGGAPTGETGTSDHPALVPVQGFLPFAVRPPLFFDEPPETIRPFKETIPRLSGKEGSKQVPSWARGQRPYVAEKGRDFAKRLMDEQYGRGTWEQDRGDEFNQLKKYGDRNFRDPKSILLPDKDDEI